jgi:hypothetical protein
MVVGRLRALLAAEEAAGLGRGGGEPESHPEDGGARTDGLVLPGGQRLPDPASGGVGDGVGGWRRR